MLGLAGTCMFENIWKQITIKVLKQKITEKIGNVWDLKFNCQGSWNGILKGEVSPRGGGGGVLRFGSDGGVPLKPAKPVPIFKGHFGGKGYPLLRILVKKIVFLCTLATKRAKISSIYSKITKVGGMFKVFQLKTIPYV